MELKIYNNLEDFKEYYLDGLAEFFVLNGSKLKLLRQYKEKYNLLEIKQKNLIADEIIFEGTDFLEVFGRDSSEVIDDIKDQLRFGIPKYHHIFFDEFIEENKLDIVKINKQLLKTYENYNNYKIRSENPLFNFDALNLFEIQLFLNSEIYEEKNNLIRYGGNAPKPEEPEELTANQQQKIGLLIRSGIIQFLREKNPKISNNQIAGFIQLLTQEPMKKESINPHLVESKENPKHPLHKIGSADDADAILRKFGINPQADS